MTQHEMLHCQLITPEACLLDTPAGCVILPAYDGEVGVLPDRAPLLCGLGIGEMRVTTAGETKRYYIDGGFAHVLQNEVVILTQRASAVNEIDLAQAERELAQLQDRTVVGLDEVEEHALAMKRVRTKIKLAGTH